MEMRSCSLGVKKLIKVGLPEGGGSGFPFKRGGRGLIMNVIAKKYCVSIRVLNLFQDLFVSYLKVLVGVGTKNNSLVRTENSSSVNVWSGMLCIFLLHWQVYVLIYLVVNLRNEDLHWFSGKRTFIDGGVYMRFSGGVGSRVTCSVFM